MQMFAPEVKLHLEKLRRFGCIAYLAKTEFDGKFDPRGEKAVFVGYENTGYIFWHPPTGIIVRNVRDVGFNEKVTYRDAYKTQMPADVAINSEEREETEKHENAEASEP